MRSITLLGLGLLLALSAPAQETAADSRPNVLFLFADDQRPDAVGAFGNPHIRTPNIDAIAARGYRFASNYCMGSIHGAVCQPSRAMILTGRTLYNVPMNMDGVTTLPELFGAHGYATFGTGKWHNGGDSFLRSFQRGKTVMLGGMSDHTQVPVSDVTPEHAFSEKRAGTKFSSELFADSVIEFIEGHDREETGRPFFAYVAFTAPHDPRQPPLELREYYYEHRPPLPENFMPQHPFHNGWMVGRDEKLAAWPRTRSVISDQLAEYYGLITHMDGEIGRILETLERTGHSGDTIIVYAADHGLALGSHGLLGKQSVYEHSMGCPLIFAGPGVPHGSSNPLTYLLDVFPTLCELAQVPLPEGVEGKSLVPLWRGEESAVRDSLFLIYEDKMRAVRDERYKLIRYPLIDHTQLFDLATDPSELRDLAGEPEHQERVEQMMETMRAWQRDVDDPHPLEVDEPEPMEIDLSGRERKPDRWQPQWIVKKYFGDD